MEICLRYPVNLEVGTSTFEVMEAFKSWTLEDNVIKLETTKYTRLQRVLPCRLIYIEGAWKMNPEIEGVALSFFFISNVPSFF